MNFTNLLYKIQRDSPSTAPETIILPTGKVLYEIDLSTRTIHGPETLSVQSDHYAETVYFLVDRYYDNMDLAQTNCVVQYVSSGESYVYAVPFCDVTTYEGKMIIPWTISASATKNSGVIRYFLRFYLVEGITSSETNEIIDAKFTYSLSTLTAQSTVLKTLSAENFVSEDEVLGIDVEMPERYFELVDIMAQMVDNSTIYWIEASSVPPSQQEEATDGETP